MTTYSISLDDVDLALLPVRAGGYNNFLRREHYEFQVLTREDEDPPLHIIHPCHICAIDVPAVFWSAHCASAKHRANALIATAAARRTSALINATPPPALQPAGKFCDSCTAIAGEDHEKTKEHRVSVIQDRMLGDLVKIYTGEDFDGEEFRNEALANEEINENKDTSANAVNDMPKTDLNTVNKDGTNTTTIPKEEELPKENATQGTHSNKIDNETYIRLLNIPSFPKIQIQPSGDRILILANNERINVLSDNFHSYHRLRSKIQCRVCCCTINVTEEETHKLSMIHMKRIMQVVEDSHCIREIFTDWSHCILCNQVITNKMVNSHKHSMFHCDRKAICTVPRSTMTENVKRVSEPTSNTAANSEGNKPNQRMMPKEGAGAENTGGPSNCNNAPNQKGQVNKSNNMIVHKSKEDTNIEYPYMATEFPSSVYCVVCKCHVPNKFSNRSGHLKGARHAFSMKNNKK